MKRNTLLVVTLLLLVLGTSCSGEMKPVSSFKKTEMIGVWKAMLNGVLRIMN